MQTLKTATKPWYSRRSRQIRAALWVTSTLLLAILGAFGWAASRFTLMPVDKGDDYLLMTAEQAKECREGGGCAIFSAREYVDLALRTLMCRPQKQGMDGGV